LKWDTVIEQKTCELSRFLVGKLSAVDFTEPSPRLERLDDGEIRAKILTLTPSHAKRLGIGKSTLHHLRKNAESNRSFRVYQKVRAKLARTI
jgi:CRISPR-associated protein Cas1